MSVEEKIKKILDREITQVEINYRAVHGEPKELGPIREAIIELARQLDQTDYNVELMANDQEMR